MPAGLVDPRDAVLVVVDVQEKFMKAIPGAEKLIDNIVFLVKAAKLLGIPVLVTEQYPEGLGRTVEKIRGALSDMYRPLEKRSFSILGEKRVEEEIERLGRKTLILAGIETHICLLQTSLDAVAKGYRVYLVTDAVASRNMLDHETALRRMEKHGVELVTSEMIVYEIMRTAEHPAFKEILKLVKERSRPQ